MSKRAHCSVYPKALNKRAQIFLLAAVIISAVVISLGITANQAKVSSEPKNFYDFSYEVKREVGAVIDYEIYTNFSENDNLEEFVDILAENIRDNNPDANFIFIYGDKNGITLKTYNPKESEKASTISIGEFYKEIKSGKKITKEVLSKTDLQGAENIIVEIRDREFSFSISDHRQVIFLMQKDIENEKFVTAK